MWLQNPLDDILSSKAKVGVLRVVCSVNAPLSGREIARRAAISSGNASRVLGELTRSGVLLARDLGRVTTYELRDPDVTLVRRLRELFLIEAKRRDSAIRDLVAGLPGVVSVVLFGSEARGEAAPGSDTDLLIVVDRKTRGFDSRLVDKGLRVSRQHGVALSWHVVTVPELRRWERTSHPLWRNIQVDGVPLHGTALHGLRLRCQPGRPD
jgi:predicted nucleotidyltransferase